MHIIAHNQTKHTIDKKALLSPGSRLFTYWKDIDGRYLGCNEDVVEFSGESSIKDIEERTDLDFSWRDTYPIILEHEHLVKSRLETRYFTLTARGAKGNVGLISINAPLISVDGLLSGVVGVSVVLNQTSYADILSQFVKAAEILHFKIEPRMMINIITQGMQLNNCHNQWQQESKLFDYGSVAFTLREAQCFHYLLRGYSADKTEQQLKRSQKTVEFHIASIKKKLGCENKSQLVNKAMDVSCIDLMFMQFDCC